MDAEDLLALPGRVHVRNSHTRGYRVYSYARVWIGGKSVPIHRWLLRNPSGLFVDHANGNTLDNRRDNLRACTRSENVRNRAINQRHGVGLKCVSLHRGRYTARIQVDGKRWSLGTFPTAAEAHAAYVAASRKHHGEFARFA